MTFEISPDIFTVFNKIKYIDEPHKYYVKENEYISVTTLIHKYVEDFNEQFWAEYKGNEFKVNPELIKRAWKFINKKGTMKGSMIHDYIENLLLNKIFKYPKNLILNEFGFDPIIKEYEITKKHVDKFYKDIFGKLIPIKTELVVFDDESLIAGMLDILFYNVKEKEFQIWDNKTNKALTLENKERHLKDDLFMLEQSDLEIYSLQLDLYKYIIEKNTNIKLGKSYIVWFSHRNDTYKIIKTKDRSFYVKKIVENRINEIGHALHTQF